MHDHTDATAPAAGPLCPCCARPLWATELQRFACGLCQRTLRGWLAELPAQMVVLRGSHQREAGDGPKVAGSRTAPLPGREDVLNLVGPSAPGDVHDPYGDQHGPRPVADVLVGWVRLVTEERHLHGPTGRPTVEQLAAWLEPHLDWCTRQPWCPDMHGELQEMMRTIRGITRVRPCTRPIPRPCPRCDALALTERDWDPYITCGECESLYTLADLALDAHLRLARQEAAA